MKYRHVSSRMNWKCTLMPHYKCGFPQQENNGAICHGYGETFLIELWTQQANGANGHINVDLSLVGQDALWNVANLWKSSDLAKGAYYFSYMQHIVHEIVTGKCSAVSRLHSYVSWHTTFGGTLGECANSAKSCCYTLNYSSITKEWSFLNYSWLLYAGPISAGAMLSACKTGVLSRTTVFHQCCWNMSAQVLGK